MNIILKVIIWIILHICILITNQLALFLQNSEINIKRPFYVKILISEFWASIGWVFIIPSQKLGFQFLNPLQLALFQYTVSFIAQIISNKFWLNVANTYDDYLAMIIIILAMIVSKIKIFG
jgi:uncharacterized protein (DUF486 family)